MDARRLTTCALLTAIALTIFVAESQIPLPFPLPGMKLGLANVVTVYAMFALGPGDTLMIFLSRIVLGSLFAGGSTLPYSLAGGLCCYLIMLPLHKLLTEKQLWVCGAISAIFHNLGQIGMSILITRTPALIAYLPFLLVMGVPAGAFTGLAAQLLLARLKPAARKDAGTRAAGEAADIPAPETRPAPAPEAPIATSEEASVNGGPAPGDTPAPDEKTRS